VLQGSGRNLTETDSALRSFWSAGGELGLQVELFPPVFVELGGTAAFPLIQRRFVVGRPATVVGKTPTLVLTGSLAVGVRLGS
jgi:hypothetical protein